MLAFSHKQHLQIEVRFIDSPEYKSFQNFNYASLNQNMLFSCFSFRGILPNISPLQSNVVPDIHVGVGMNLKSGGG